MNSMARTFIIIAALMGVVFAGPGGGISGLQAALSELCGQLQTLVPVAAMLMVVLASVIYATGQMMGAETRARANVWATSCLTGALFGILISVIAPGILTSISNGQTISCG